MSEQKPFAARVAALSVFIPLRTFAMNALALASGSVAIGYRAGVLSMALYPIALILGVLALLGVRKHGTRGILVRGLLGVTLNALLIIFAIVTISHARQTAQTRALPENITSFTCTPPPGFVDYPAGRQSSPRIRYAFFKTDPKGNMVLLIEDLGGRIARTDMSRFVAGHDNMRLLHEKWKALDIDVCRAQHHSGSASSGAAAAAGHTGDRTRLPAASLWRRP